MRRTWMIYCLCTVATILAMMVAKRTFVGGNLMAQTEVHSHEAVLKNPDGSWKYTNALAKESSPYLLQHAHNPVEWYPWGSEAFELAGRIGKPIFLSVGYSTCYWCHVMERQVFENPEIAALMNEHFVNIKVDREERPDVDDIYMAAVQLITQRGGWPMSVFLTPPRAGGPDDSGLKPFYAGTYFPPAPQRGMPGFPQIVEGLSQAWRERRQEVLQQAEQVAGGVSQHLSHRDEQEPIDAGHIQDVVDQLLSSYDQTHGGFGSQPKFPQPANLGFLLRRYRGKPDNHLWTVIRHTLDRMARGGMYDQIGGGFHRYSTDAKWLVPHFEKMLYDNGQLVETYCIAHTIRPRAEDPDFYTRLVRHICDYVLREMTDSTGTFWSAQDAEVDAREGGNYVWTKQEMEEAVIDSQLIELTQKMYGFDEGENFKDPHDPNAQWVNVLFLPKPLHELAGSESLRMDQLLERKMRIDQRMLKVRDGRKQPATDDKVLTSWNGLMIGGFALAGRTLDEPKYIEAAARSANYIVDHMRTDDGRLYRTMRHGRKKISGFLDDYAYFVHGLLELYRSDQNPKWLDAAQQLMRIAQTQFGAEGGGYYDTQAAQADLFVRTRGTYDGAISSGNSQMIHNLLDLHELAGDERNLDRAITDLESFAGSLKRLGVGMVHMTHALLRVVELAPARFGEVPASLAVATLKEKGMQIDIQPNVVNLSSGQATVHIKLNIDDIYHINAHEPGMEGLIPSAIHLSRSDGLSIDVEYPPGESKRFPFGGDPINIYEGEIQFDVTLARTDGPGPQGEVALTFTYQMCTDRQCMAPRTIKLPVEIRVE